MPSRFRPSKMASAAASKIRNKAKKVFHKNNDKPFYTLENGSLVKEQSFDIVPAVQMEEPGHSAQRSVVQVAHTNASDLETLSCNLPILNTTRVGEGVAAAATEGSGIVKHQHQVMPQKTAVAGMSTSLDFGNTDYHLVHFSDPCEDEDLTAVAPDRSILFEPYKVAPTLGSNVQKCKARRSLRISIVPPPQWLYRTVSSSGIPAEAAKMSDSRDLVLYSPVEGPHPNQLCSRRDLTLSPTSSSWSSPSSTLVAGSDCSSFHSRHCSKSSKDPDSSGVSLSWIQGGSNSNSSFQFAVKGKETTLVEALINIHDEMVSDEEVYENIIDGKDKEIAAIEAESEENLAEAEKCFERRLDSLRDEHKERIWSKNEKLRRQQKAAREEKRELQGRIQELSDALEVERRQREGLPKAPEAAFYAENSFLQATGFLAQTTGTVYHHYGSSTTEKSQFEEFLKRKDEHIDILNANVEYYTLEMQKAREERAYERSIAESQFVRLGEALAENERLKRCNAELQQFVSADIGDALEWRNNAINSLQNDVSTLKQELGQAGHVNARMQRENDAKHTLDDVVSETSDDSDTSIEDEEVDVEDGDEEKAPFVIFEDDQGFRHEGEEKDQDIPKILEEQPVNTNFAAINPEAPRPLKGTDGTLFSRMMKQYGATTQRIQAEEVKKAEKEELGKLKVRVGRGEPGYQPNGASRDS